MLIKPLCIFCTALVLHITNQSSLPLYVSAATMDIAKNEIEVTPQKIEPHTANVDIHLSHIATSLDYFEIYFGLNPYDQTCTFAYEFGTGLLDAECSDYPNWISNDRMSIYFGDWSIKKS
jgi:hypothetical protein